jgi:phage gp36-like protein
MYVTPAQLADGSGAAQELTQLFDVVSIELLKATIAGADRSSWSAEEIAVADIALDAIEKAIALADGEVDARLSHRGYLLPQDPVRFPVLTVWARAIARYHLNLQRDLKDEDTGRTERDYRDALRALQQVADGKLSLGADDPLARPTPGSTGAGPEVCAPPRIFDRDTLADY